MHGQQAPIPSRSDPIQQIFESLAKVIGNKNTYIVLNTTKLIRPEWMKLQLQMQLLEVNKWCYKAGS